jgi:hypothetical protein
MFSNLLSKVFGHSTKSVTAPTTTAAAAPTKPADAATASTAGATLGSASASGTPAPAPAATPTPAQPQVDVTAVLDGLAAKNPEKLDWKKSIVDLLKLVDMDSSLSARKELAAELHYTGDTSDSGALNVWLHKEVIKQIAANGGKVPANLLD